MLEEHLSATITSPMWENVHARAELPCAEQDYFGISGASPTSPDSRRRYRRIRVRGHVAVKRGSETLGAYTIDVSPVGTGFYSPIQLYPKERVTVMFADYGPLEVQITRCRRVRPKCYACGGMFLQNSMSPAMYREFLRMLKV